MASLTGVEPGAPVVVPQGPGLFRVGRRPRAVPAAWAEGPARFRPRGPKAPRGSGRVGRWPRAVPGAWAKGPAPIAPPYVPLRSSTVRIVVNRIETSNRSEKFLM
jgi:hypothetical protein